MLHSQDEHEARNIIFALEEFRHEGAINSNYSLNDSWAKKPAIRRTVMKRI